MARLSYNKERFTKVNKYDVVNDSYTGILAASKFNQKNGQDYKLLDVIDIDFDGTWFKPTQSYINNADEFFVAMESLDKTKDLAYISKQIEDITSSYITRSEFESIIGNYQGALNYGDHIAVVGDNTLIAYDVISNSQLYEFSTSYVSYSYLADTTYTKAETNALIAYKISELIGGADEAFDTMQEISEWIMNQTTFVEVPYEQIDTTSGNKYYIYNTQTGKYEQVDKEYIESHPNDTYYEIESLKDEIQAINDKIGYKILDPNGISYTYTGILKDLQDLVEKDYIIMDKIDNLSIIANNARTESINAFNKASEAYGMAYSAYQISEIAIDTANSNTEKSNLAYEMAYYSITEVGVASYQGYYRALTDEERETTEDGTLLYEFDGFSYKPIYFNHRNTTTEYLTYIEPVIATGMHKVVEDSAYMANTALYRLNLDNENEFTGYITMSLSPESYTGDPSRTLTFNVEKSEYSYENYIIDSTTILEKPNMVKNVMVDNDGNVHVDINKINKDGIITAYQINTMFSDLISWDLIKIEQ